MGKIESKFQKDLKDKIRCLFPGALVFKNDSGYIQGIPDLTIIYKDKWAALECKRCKNAQHRPNQDYYVDKFNNWAFCRFIYPENEKEVLDELKVYFHRS